VVVDRHDRCLANLRNLNCFRHGGRDPRQDRGFQWRGYRCLSLSRCNGSPGPLALHKSLGNLGAGNRLSLRMCQIINTCLSDTTYVECAMGGNHYAFSFGGGSNENLIKDTRYTAPVGRSFLNYLGCGRGLLPSRGIYQCGRNCRCIAFPCRGYGARRIPLRQDGSI